MTLTCEPTTTPEIDLPHLRSRYRQEALRRLRPEGYQQYVEAVNDYAEFSEADPYSPPVVRNPVSDDIDVAILGGGFAGLIAGARLKQAGVTSIRFIETGGDFGGTWYWNRYPGIQCDTESYIYLPLLEETNCMPTQRYASGQEIYEHCRRVGRHFELYEGALFGTTIQALRWDERIKRWRLATNRGDDIRAKFVILSAGILNKPKLPGIPGIRNFRGRMFHTARWDYNYTGGNAGGGLMKLADKRVGLIGTGATAIQCVPFLGQYAKQLYVFQRTPSYVDERGNRATDLAWVRSQKPGWQAVRQRSFQTGSNGAFAPGEEDLICDGFTEISRNLQATLTAMGNPSLTPAQVAELRELEDYKAMERIRRRVEGIVHDKTTAGTLKAWYRFGCKRPCFSDTYLPTFNRPNVTLVDVSGTRGVERIAESSVVVDGKYYDVDCIIFASGYEVTTDLRRRLGIETIDGRDGLSLFDHWRDGYKTLHGATTHGFPNFFFTVFTQGALAASITLGYERQAAHIAYIVKETLNRGMATVEPTPDAQDAWVKEIRESSAFDPKFWQECTPGYFNHEGDAIKQSPIFGEVYGSGFYAFDQLLTEWRDRGDMAGLSLG